jgi:hypothetical protein
MKRTWLAVLGATLAVVLVGLVVTNAVFAQTPTPSTPTQGSAADNANGRTGAMSDIATLLGMTQDQIWAERVVGKTLSDLAKQKAVSDSQLTDLLVADEKTMLDQMVTDGRMTQAQADTYLTWYKQLAGLLITQPYGPGGAFGGTGYGRGPGRGGRGGHWGWQGTAPTQPTTPSVTPAPSSTT